MADIDVERKATARPAAAGKGLAQQSWLWALIAVLAVGGLMWWLAYASEVSRETTAVRETADAPAAATADRPAAEGAELEGVAADPAGFAGRRLEFENVQVAATLGPRGFWADVPGANPFLVLFAPDLTAPVQVAPNQTLHLQGTVAAVTDSLLDEWVASGAIDSGRRDEAGFATHYLLADLLVAQQ